MALTRLLSIKQGVLSNNPGRVSNFTLLAIHGHGQLIGFWRPGEVVWTKIESELNLLAHVNYFNTKFYVMDLHLNIGVWDGDTDLPICRVWCDHRLFSVKYYREQVYLATQSSLPSEGEEGKLLSVARAQIFNEDSSSKTDFLMYRQDIGSKACEEVVNDIGGAAVFLGYNSAVSFSEAEAKRSGIKGNRVYFASHFGLTAFFTEKGAKGMGIYNVKDGSIRRIRGADNLRHPIYSFDENCNMVDALERYVNPPLWMYSGN